MEQIRLNQPQMPSSLVFIETPVLVQESVLIAETLAILALLYFCGQGN